MQTQMDGGTVKIGKKMAGLTSAIAPMGALDYHKSVISMDGMNGATYQEGFSSGHGEGMWGMMNQINGSGFYSEFGGRESGVGGGVFDDMGLPDHFLRQYYSQVRSITPKNLQKNKQKKLVS